MVVMNGANGVLAFYCMDMDIPEICRDGMTLLLLLQYAFSNCFRMDIYTVEYTMHKRSATSLELTKKGS
jgi:hypothetical protein